MAENEAVRWDSDGQGEFTIEPIDMTERGTRVTLHLKEAESEFAEGVRLESLIRKYSDHIAFPVLLKDAADADAETKTVNSHWPASHRSVICQAAGIFNIGRQT